jgi:hypothetical protein
MSDEKDLDENRINWHLAFYEAIQMELEEYSDNLQFIIPKRKYSGV